MKTRKILSKEKILKNREIDHLGQDRILGDAGVVPVIARLPKAPAPRGRSPHRPPRKSAFQN